MAASNDAAPGSVGRWVSSGDHRGSGRCLALLLAISLLLAGAFEEGSECADGQCSAEVEEPSGLLKDMKLYDDSRWEYALRMFEYFVEAVDDLAHHAHSPEDSTRVRLRFLRSVDVMSYTVGIQELYEQFPPRALHDTEDAGSVKDRLIEGASLWCHVKDAAHPQAHEFRVLERLLTGLSDQPVGKENLQGADIGSGYGPWTRMVAFQRPDVSLVVGVEYQEHLRRLAERFTEYAFRDLESLQHHTSFWQDARRDTIGNDVFTWFEQHHAATEHPRLDFIISFLAVLHIGFSQEDKAALFHGFAERLRPGGRIYIEDIVALPAALDEARPHHLEKLRDAVSMNVFPTHDEYSKLLREADFGPADGSKAVVFDTSAAWRNFVLARSIAFRTLNSKSSFCLLRDARIIPETMPHEKQDEVACHALELILRDTKLVDAYLASQSSFFCEVCEIFNGRGKLAKADCQCPGSDDPTEDHPPLAGGIIAFAVRQ